MHTLLTKLLQKRNIESVDSLDKEEKEVFDNYERVLSKRELTVEEIKNFCKTQTEIIESKWRDYGVEQSKKVEILPYYMVYKTLLGAIDSPQKEREAMESYLTQLIK